MIQSTDCVLIIVECYNKNEGEKKYFIIWNYRIVYVLNVLCV